jgi:hypothetical protein
MSESLKDILLRRDDSQPPEIDQVKNFVFKRFKAQVRVEVRQNQLVIIAPGAALAGTLRLHIFELQNAVETKKKLLIRIG